MSELVVNRIFNVPRDLVFKAFTEPEHLVNWWGGSRTAKIQVETFELKPQGKFVYSQKRDENSNRSYALFVYEEIDSPSRIVFVSGFADEKGEFARAFFAADFPLQIRNTWTFEEIEGGKTSLTARGQPLNATEAEEAFFASMLGNMATGFGGTFDQLEEYLATLA